MINTYYNNPYVMSWINTYQMLLLVFYSLPYVKSFNIFFECHFLLFSIHFHIRTLIVFFFLCTFSVLFIWQLSDFFICYIRYCQKDYFFSNEFSFRITPVKYCSIIIPPFNIFKTAFVRRYVEHFQTYCQGGTLQYLARVNQ